MSIIITGRNMPYSCAGCPLAHDGFDGGTYCSLGVSGCPNWDERPEDCPLKEYEERPKGKWILDDETACYSLYHCSECGKTTTKWPIQNLLKEYPYCHYCGAEMKKEVSKC